MKLVALIGSTLFMDEFHRQARHENMKGNMAIYCHVRKSKDYTEADVGPAQKTILAGVIKEQVKRADEVLVVNFGGYVGDNTKEYIDWARALGKSIRYTEEER
jgi:exopolysaccharide biosynthesis protein